MPIRPAMARAVEVRSPVTISTSSPSPCMRAIAGPASGLAASETETSPTGTSSLHTANGVNPEAASRSVSADIAGESPSGRPTRIRDPSTVATDPAPGRTSWSLDAGTSIPRSRAARTTAAAMGCSDPDSAAAASASTSAMGCPSAGTISASVIAPSVTVPVLSSRTVSAALARSNTAPPLKSTPSSAARPVPAMIAAGVARPSAHGHAMSTTATACSSAAPGACGSHASHPRNVSAATPRTNGTKIAETRSAIRWIGAFEPWACSSRRTISASLVFGPTAVTKTTSRPCPLMAAPTTSSPGSTSTGIDSPVSSDRSTQDRPCFTTPSEGIFSPGRTTTSEPGCRSSIGMRRSCPSTSRVASFAPRSSSAREASPAVIRARASRTFPTRMSVTITAAVSK